MKFRMGIQERRAIQDLLDHGTDIKDIAAIIHRSKPAVYAEIKKNGGVRLYNAEKAQENCDAINKAANKDKNVPYLNLKKRVEKLEEILSKLVGYPVGENEKDSQSEGLAPLP